MKYALPVPLDLSLPISTGPAQDVGDDVYLVWWITDADKVDINNPTEG